MQPSEASKRRGKSVARRMLRPVSAGRRARLSNLLPSGESSALLQLVKAEKAARAREERLKQREERKVEKEVAQQAAADWDNATFAEGLAQLSSFWEVGGTLRLLSRSTLERAAEYSQNYWAPRNP